MKKLTKFVPFGELVRSRLGMQCQYASRYVGGLCEYPDLSQGLRFQGSRSDYHSLTIHQDDVEEFIKRVKAERGLL